MFQFALVQNESEMLRYGWADIRPLLDELDYPYDSFTAENIGDLIIGLEGGKYDALIIATNACNDKNVHDTLVRGQKVIEDFLGEGRGLFLSFQMRLTDRSETGFLPKDLEVAMVNRSEAGTEGRLLVKPEAASHSVLTFPHRIQAESIVTQCLNNEFVKSLYKGYLDALNPSVYDCVVSDVGCDEERGLILCTRQDIRPRIAISTIVLDWQAHKALLENCVRYVVEGRPYIAVLDHLGAVDVGYQYLVENLRMRKLPHRVYRKSRFDVDDVRTDVHDVILVDPSWKIDEVDQEVVSRTLRDSAFGAKCVFFDALPGGESVVSYVCAPERTRSMLSNVAAWIQLQYDRGRWQKSFWATFDVIELFTTLDVSIEQYKDEILERIGVHDIKGSYDEVMGATCALLKVYFWLLGPDSEQYVRTRRWIKKMLSEVSFYEKCSAMTTMRELEEEVSEDSIREVRTELIGSAHHLHDELRLYRAGLTLLVFGYCEDALSVAGYLGQLQEENGRWVNTSRTASVVLFLMRLQRECPQQSQEIDQMIYRAIIYLKDRYDDKANNWNNDVPATAKALRAVLEFERNVGFPVDDVVGALVGEQASLGENRGVELAARANERLRGEIVSLEGRIKALQKSKHRIGRVAGVGSAIVLPLVALLALVVLFAIYSKGASAFTGFISEFIGAWADKLFGVVTPFVVVGTYVALRSFGAIPKISESGELISRQWRRLIGRDESHVAEPE